MVATHPFLGHTFFHYRILGRLGGGAGLVYEAEDLNLGRRVALKFLPAELARSPQALERLRRAARAAYDLDHPNICASYELGDASEQPFLVMQLLSGQTLAQRIEGKPLPLASVLDWGIEIADALDAAHACRILHGNITAANVFIHRSNQVKLLNFGLASIMERYAAGTTAFMPPERVYGEEIDVRPDLLSFGALLYEMATGRRPCTGQSATALHEANPDLSPKLEEIIQKALREDRNLRYESAAELRADLTRLKRETDSGYAAASGTANRAENSEFPGVAVPAPQHSDDAGATSTAATDERRRGWTRKQSFGSKIGTIAREYKSAVGMAIASVLILSAGAGYGVYSFLHRGNNEIPSRDLTITRITHSGKATQAAISPDGKSILHVEDDDGREGLWIRNIAADSDIQIIAPAPVTYESLAFSPDGNSIYFSKDSNGLSNLYRGSVPGGMPKIIVRDIDSAIAISPGGRRIAYIRVLRPERGKWQLLSANPDGTDEKALLIEPGVPGPRYLAWSPDGERIACSVALFGNALGGVDMLDLGTGRMSTFAQFNDKTVHEIAWRRDGSGLLMDYRSRSGSGGQIGFLSYPGAKFWNITNDTDRYNAMTVSADGMTLAAVREQLPVEIDMLPGNGNGRPVQVPGIDRLDAVKAFNWTADGYLLIAGGGRLIRMSLDGRDRFILLSDSASIVDSAAACPAKQSIVLAWGYHHGSNMRNVWRVQNDGSNPKQLTAGALETQPTCSPNGKWVYYLDSLTQQFMRVQLAGGTPEAVPGSAVPKALYWGLALSPDGKTIAFFAGRPPAYVSKLALDDLAATGNRAPRLLETAPLAKPVLAFTPDGRAVAYVIDEKGVDNIWVQPLDGSKGRQITNFISEKIREFHWSPDGGSLALLRYDTTSDVVLLRGRGSGTAPQ